MKHNQKRQKSTKSQAKLYMYVNLLFFSSLFKKKSKKTNKSISSPLTQPFLETR